MLTQAQLAKIGLYLGYNFSASTSQMVLSAASISINVGGDSIENLICSTLTEIEKTQEQINDARLGAGRSFQSGSGGTSQYFRGDRLSELRQSARQQVHYLSQLLNLVVAKDVFDDNPGNRGSYGGRITRA